MGKPTMDDVARRAGVSRALVSLALRGSPKVSATSSAAVQAAADELGYRPNLIARHLASKQTRTFGLVINDLHNPYFPGVADGVLRAAEAHGYRLLLQSAFLDDAHEQAALDTFIDYRVDGIILTGARLPSSCIEAAARSVPVVVVSRPMRSALVDTLNNDDTARRDPGDRAPDRARASAHLPHRRRARRRRLAAAGRLRAHDAASTGSSRTSCRARSPRRPASAAAERALATRPTAHRDLRRQRRERARRARRDRGVGPVGARRHVAGRLRQHLRRRALRHVSLTTVEQGRERLGELAVETLIDRIEGGRTEAVHEVVPPHPRASATPPHPRPVCVRRSVSHRPDVAEVLEVAAGGGAALALVLRTRGSLGRTGCRPAVVIRMKLTWPIFMPG